MTNDNNTSREHLLESILDDSTQMIQLSDLDSFTMLYANKQARIYTGHADTPYVGEHCYQYMMGLDQQCPFCPMLHSNGQTTYTTEVDNGKEIYAVKTKITEWNGRKAFIEYAWDITEIRRSQNIFESQMSTLLQSIPEAQGIFHFDITDDQCLSINGSSKTLENFDDGASVDHVVQMIASFVPDKKGQEEFMTTFCRNALASAYKKGEVQIVKETDSYFDDGSIRSARITARLLMNPATDHLECIIYGMDISGEIEEKKLYEQNLREQFDIFTVLSRDYLNIFLINANNGTARILKLDGYVTSGLDSSKDISYPYYATCEQYIDERVHPDDRAVMREAMKLEKVRSVLSNTLEYVSSYRILVDGEIHYYQFKYTYLKNTDRIIAAFQNIDAIIASEREQQQVLSKALQAAEQSSRAKTTFLNSMSHDIRTPLNAIIGFTHLALSAIDDAGKQEALIPGIRSYLSKISTSGNQLLALVNDVLDMSHIESGKMRIEQTHLNLLDALEDLKMMIQPDINKNQLHLTYDVSGIVHANVITDKLRLNQVLLNILSNAVKFTPSGGRICFRVIEEPSSETARPLYKFYIKDNGIGMNDEFKNHIFEPFTREYTSTISGVQGTGLGMSIAKSIVDVMGGTITFESELGMGTEFIVAMPLELDDSISEAATDHRLESSASAVPFTAQDDTFAGKKILLVEDNELNREIALEILESAGFILDTAEDGTIAVEKMRTALPGQYDLVLMDIQMPQMNGYEAARQIRQLTNPAVKDIPIIAMTANAFAEDRQKALEAGMNEHITKPIDIPKLIDTLHEILNK